MSDDDNIVLQIGIGGERMVKEWFFLKIYLGNPQKLSLVHHASEPFYICLFI